MSVRSAQSVTDDFTTANPTTMAAVNADSLPTGTLVLNGTDNGATVTVTNVTTGVYKFAVTMPTLAVGDLVSVRIAATVSAIAGVGVVWRDTCDLSLDSSGRVDLGMTGGVMLGTAAAGYLPADVRKVLGADASGTANDDITFLRNVAEGDWSIDTTTTPWSMVVKTKGTSTELVRKKLRDVGGADLTAVTTVIGSSKES